MKQLQLRDGDLVLGPGGFGTVEGAPRVAQDLGCAVREEIGTDRFHPKWGTVLHQYVGRGADIDTASLVRAEVARVVQNYVVIQQDQLTKAADAGLRPRFRADDVIASVSDIQIQQQTDRINVRVFVTTSAGSTVPVVRSVEAD